MELVKMRLFFCLEVLFNFFDLYLFKWIVTKKPVRVEFLFQVLNYSSRLPWFVHGQKLSNFVVHSKIYL